MNNVKEYGLQPNHAVTSVHLKCDPGQEAVSYTDVEPHFEGALGLGQVCHLFPVQLIWGIHNDLVWEHFLHWFWFTVANAR